MIMKQNYITTDSASNSGYDSDTSNSTNSTNSTNSNSSNSSINNYTNDVLKQNNIYSQRHMQKQKQKQKLILRQRQLRIQQDQIQQEQLELCKNNNLNNYDLNPILCREIGLNSVFDKDTPLINYLITKRINFCELGTSSHIAAFIPASSNSRYCFIRDWKGKDCYG